MSRWRAYSKRSMAAVSRNRNRPTRDRGCDVVRRHGTVSKQCCRWHGLIIIGPPTGPPWASRSLARSCCKLRTQPTEGMSDGDSSRPSIRTFLTKVIINYLYILRRHTVRHPTIVLLPAIRVLQPAQAMTAFRAAGWQGPPPSVHYPIIQWRRRNPESWADLHACRISSSQMILSGKYFILKI